MRVKKASKTVSNQQKAVHAKVSPVKKSKSSVVVQKNGKKLPVAKSKAANATATSVKAVDTSKTISLAHVTNKCELDTTQVSKAVSAAFKAFEVTSKESRGGNLFEDDPVPVILLVSAIKISDDKPQALKVKLPHPYLTNESDICLIVKDLQKGWKVDHEPTNQHYLELLESKGISVSEIMALRQLRIEYKPYEARFKLSKRFDALLCDKRVVKFVPRYLGKSFYQAGKLPISLDLEAKHLKQEFDDALSTSTMSMSHNGTSSQIVVGLSNQTEDAIASNIVAVYKALSKSFPGKFENVRSLAIRFGNDAWTVPIYVSYATRDSIQLPATKKRSEPLIDELTTLAPGWKIAVYPDGNVEKIWDKNYRKTQLDKEMDAVEIGGDLSDVEMDADDLPVKKSSLKPSTAQTDVDNGSGKLAKKAQTKPKNKKAADDSSEDEADELEEQYMEELEMLEELEEVKSDTEQQTEEAKPSKTIPKKQLKKKMKK